MDLFLQNLKELFLSFIICQLQLEAYFFIILFMPISIALSNYQSFEALLFFSFPIFVSFIFSY